MEISQLVRVRRKTWRIVEIRGYDGCQLVALAGLEPRSAARVRRFLTPFDVIEVVKATTRPFRISTRRWRRVCRRLIAADAPPGRLRSAARARFDLLPHQLEPALAVVRGFGTRVLLADAVGLGKTIQAGLIVAELCARRCVDRVLVLAPAGLRQQWARELRQRFQLDVSIADAVTLRQLTAGLPVGANPWTTTPTTIASVDYVKRPEVLPAVRACRWDLVVVDEAHGAVGDSARHHAVRILAAGAAYVILVTATPHSGDDRTFVSLCQLGRLDDDALVVFSRPRATVSAAPARRVGTLPVRTSGAELQMHALLVRYTDAVRAEHGDRALAMSVLHKRAFSGPWALAESVARRLRALSSRNDLADVDDLDRQLLLPLDDPDGELVEEDAPPAWPTGLRLADPGREHRLLTELLEAARSADGCDSKLRSVGRLLERVQESIIIFTEYRDTLSRLRERIGVQRPVILLHGGLAPEERERALHDFARQPRAILLATDAAGQGLNMHHHCRLVVSLELPWNPMRLEQRIGRVDRIGQTRRVHAIHFVGAATNEIRVLSRLRSRLARAAVLPGGPDPLGCDDELETARMVIGASSSRGDALPAAPHSVQGLLTMPDLRDEAEREADRLAGSRRFVDRQNAPRNSVDLITDPVTDPITDLIQGRVPMIARARRWRTRSLLHAGALLIWRVTAVDGDGTLVESRLAATLVDPGLVRPFAVAAETAAAIHDAAVSWRESARQISAAFWGTRLRRERSMTRCAFRPSDSIFQPGLFDRRAERAWSELQTAETERLADLQARLIATERQSRYAFCSPELILVLTS